MEALRGPRQITARMAIMRASRRWIARA